MPISGTMNTGPSLAFVGCEISAGTSAGALWHVLAEAGFVDAQHPTRVPALPEGCVTTRLLVQGRMTKSE